LFTAGANPKAALGWDLHTILACLALGNGVPLPEFFVEDVDGKHLRAGYPQNGVGGGADAR